MAEIIQPFIPGDWRRLVAVTATSQNLALPELRGDECLMFTNTGTVDIAIEFFGPGGGAGEALNSTNACGLVVLARSQVTYTPPPGVRSFIALILMTGSAASMQIVKGLGT